MSDTPKSYGQVLYEQDESLCNTGPTWEKLHPQIQKANEDSARAVIAAFVRRVMEREADIRISGSEGAKQYCWALAFNQLSKEVES